jgi:hypothetical protein
MMNCSIHHDKEASFRCFECGEVICKECATEMNGKIVCKKCFEKQRTKANDNSLDIDKFIDKPIINNRYTGKYNSFWAFIFSLIPGAGQMYFGLMKRGLQIMLLFITPMFLGSMLYSTNGVLVLLNFIIWFYSFFDCQHIRRAINEGEALDDTLIWDINIQGINYKHVGMGLIVLGGLTILNNGFYRLSDYIRTNYSNDIYYFFRFIRQSSFPVLLIIIGVFLLKKAKAQK